MAIDFSARYRDYARFLPAVSEMYARYVDGPPQRRPIPTTLADLDFLNPSTNLFYLPSCLYSAGQAAKTKGKAHSKDMITGRKNPNTIVLGDSGGFQIQQGSIKWRGDETRDRLLGWLEENCDWSMILDFPTGSITDGSIKGGSTVGRILPPHTKRIIADNETHVMEWHEFERSRNGDFKRDAAGKRKIKKTHAPKPLNLMEFAEQIDLDMNNNQEAGYATCLFQTLLNNDYFSAKRTPGKTKFLNVIQGRNIEESNLWYDRVKHYDFEGWSLAGPHKEKFDLTLTRLLAFRRDGLLEGKNWMHILGVGKLMNGCVYTTMQRMIRKHDNPDFTISYDVSSPCSTAAYGNLFLGYTLDKSGWTIQSDKLDGREFLMEYETLINNPTHQIIRDGNLVPYRGDVPFLDVVRELWKNKVKTNDHAKFIETEIGKVLKMKDVCWNTDPELTSTWDTATYTMMMNHNLQVHLEAVFETQELYDKNDLDSVPYDLLILKEIIEEVLDPATKNPEEIIKTNKKALNCLAMEQPNYQIFVDGIFDLPKTSASFEEVETFQPDYSVVDIFG